MFIIEYFKYVSPDTLPARSLEQISPIISVSYFFRFRTLAGLEFLLQDKLEYIMVSVKIALSLFGGFLLEKSGCFHNCISFAKTIVTKNGKVVRKHE